MFAIKDFQAENANVEDNSMNYSNVNKTKCNLNSDALKLLTVNLHKTIGKDRLRKSGRKLNSEYMKLVYAAVSTMSAKL